MGSLDRLFSANKELGYPDAGTDDLCEHICSQERAQARALWVHMGPDVHLRKCCIAATPST